jgi:DNA repair protein RecO (recombination protein O)
VIHKTRGIVFRFTKFRETSIIVTIFTELFGLQTYIVNGVRSKNAKNKIALYQPLTLLNLVVYHREHANIERIKELSCAHPYTTIASDIRKSTLAIFIGELLNKTVKEESHAQQLFDFLFDALAKLDAMKADYENFHLIFMLRLSRYLGFGVQHVNEVIGGRVANEETENLIKVLISADFETIVKITNIQRRLILELLLKFYSDHIENFGEVKSLSVLREVLG